ncbi:MAG: hypothetical protein M3151_14155 [Actinomycetota bacterium]|nr:hypothetical protein [Actinomycetota bacterium]
MIAKEWRDARWKFLIATVLVLLLSTYLTPYAEIVEVAEQINGRVCLVTAVPPLLLALWVFRRKAF